MSFVKPDGFELTFKLLDEIQAQLVSSFDQEKDDLDKFIDALPSVKKLKHNQEREFIHEIFYGYEPDGEETDVQERRKRALRYFAVALTGRYAFQFQKAKRSKGAELIYQDQKQIDQLSQSKKALYDCVTHYLARASRDGESFWICFVDYDSTKDVAQVDLEFVLSVVGTVTDSGDDIWNELDEKTYYRLFRKQTDFFTHDNGGEAFWVCMLDDDVVSIGWNLYVEADLKDAKEVANMEQMFGSLHPIIKQSEDSRQEGPSAFVVFVTYYDVKKVWVGSSPKTEMTSFSGGYGYDGEAVLIELVSGDCVFVGAQVISFRPISPIRAFYAPVGNSDVVESYAIDAQNNYYYCDYYGIVLMTPTPAFVKHMSDPMHDVGAFYYDAKFDIKGFENIQSINYKGKQQPTMLEMNTIIDGPRALVENRKGHYQVAFQSGKISQLSSTQYRQLCLRFALSKGFAPFPFVQVHDRP